MTDLTALQQALGITFSDLSLLEQALIHSSYLNENPETIPYSNERLEYLGDAVLGLVVAEKLYRDNPDFDEGSMTRLRSALVRKETLARVAKNIGLGEHLYLGKGEDSSGGRKKPANLASALEAIIAAVYLDKGFAVTEELIHRLFDEELQTAINKRDTTDYKSQLQEIIQAREQQTPSYHVTDETGPDHNKTFNVEVRLRDTVLGSGSGKSKKEAETRAARNALKNLPDTFTR